MSNASRLWRVLGHNVKPFLCAHYCHHRVTIFARDSFARSAPVVCIRIKHATVGSGCDQTPRTTASHLASHLCQMTQWIFRKKLY